MRKGLLGFVLFGAFFAACNSDDEDIRPFVTEVEITTGTGAYDPGDLVTVAAEGFEPDDEIMFDIRWSPEDDVSGEGYARGVWGVVTGRSATSISFLAPGHYPAGKAEVLLWRGGRRMSLGTIVVNDGRSPDEFVLYGISECGGGSALDRIDPLTGEATRLVRPEEGRYLLCAVNSPGSNSLYGISSRNGHAVAVSYDLTMRYWRDSDPDRYLLPGMMGNVSAAFLRSEAGRLTLGSLTMRTPGSEASWLLPEGIGAASLTRYPFLADSRGFLFLAADNGDGTFTPVVMDMRPGMRHVGTGEPETASGLIPFRMPDTSRGEAEELRMTCGYAVVGEDATELRLFDPETVGRGELLAEIPAKVLSVAVHPGSGEFYLLCDDGGERTIRVCDPAEGTQRTLPGTVECSEIVLAR